MVKLFIYENKKKFLVIISLIFVFIFSTFILFRKEKLESESITYQNLIEEETKKENDEEVEIGNTQEEITYYFVDIKGYVNNPGV